MTHLCIIVGLTRRQCQPTLTELGRERDREREKERERKSGDTLSKVLDLTCLGAQLCRQSLVVGRV